MGVGVDYGIYLYSRFRSFYRDGDSLYDAYFKTLEVTGNGVLFTGVTLALGVATEPWLRDYYRLRHERSRAAIRALCEVGELLPLKLEGEIMKLVDNQLGAVARPARVRFVSALPKTRSGKMLRRAIQAVCELRDPGDLTTIEDPSALQQIKDLVEGA